ncbi:hypothetical protein ES705_42540 [subsurface metagenome]
MLKDCVKPVDFPRYVPGSDQAPSRETDPFYKE